MLRTLLNPINEMQQMIDFMDRTFNSVWPEATGARTFRESVLTLPVDVWEKDNRYFIRAAVPGVKPEELDIQVQDGTLILSGETKHEFESDKDAKFWRREYSFGKFRRTIRLPENINPEEIEASFDNGYVTVTVPMQPEVHKSLKVPIRSGAQQGQSALEQSNEGRNGESSVTKSKEIAGVR
jgi:HSP20 family protein